ncbi:EAL domain, c-di-GMP-specific phosphodiesterase class I (or its enzymatically inactive variant) [Pseudidiomarina planktonica]|uniref:EAL domain, c-di-GMP-specific phosphodiesterase class I (Or its enzymatically inactive variant) n=1 Tax=Pseudidiomarina planktonica TaxID=1323738 RepID=A0A1Y6FWH8_9GAMM|nr:EAL domain-containing protein [Pseudidiomarina planktonica]RUO63854.1 sensor domain-containing phosphodiesterase [Pseudidiomarina planktonica]SMQ80075.1 EAL domain, c-di-GMP-specific phosphodiesterase class I (or its enzymatically inactive variant) [Pseudidiomarina planktonica]
MKIEYEAARLSILRKLDLLDSAPSESFDRITRIASQVFNLPIAAVSLTDQDRQWFRSRVGVDYLEIPRDKSCCSEVVDQSRVLVVNDLLESEHYRDSMLAESGIRFYAGAPLMTRDGFSLGAMCVFGTEPRQFNQQELDTLRDLAAMVMAQVELQHAVGRVDSGTGLPNYLQFVEDLEDLARDHPERIYYALSTELVDLSQASLLQRVMGPSYLENLSRAGSAKLQQILGEKARVYHIGPGQFAHLETGTEAQVLVRAQRVQEALVHIKVGGIAPFMLRPVLGVVPFEPGTTNASAVLRTAHSASRDAREAELKVGLYSKQSDASHQRSFGLIADFGESLNASNQLQLFYQPQIDLRTGQCVGAEALIRWQHSTLGNISPAEFIPLVENTPLGRDLTDWVMKAAIAQTALWHQAGLPITVSVNITAANLDEEDFTDRLLGYLQVANLPLSAIGLELTESGLLSNGRAARMQLEALAASGMQISIDDFGTGYSSLAYLQDVPAQVVKIDRSFIDGVELNRRSQTLVRSMISMAHELGYRVVAEGVETEASLAFLKELGCEQVQGYLLAKPMPVEDFEAWSAVRQ